MSTSSISWRVKLGAALLTTALALFGVHYLVFRDFHHLAVFTVHDIAFLPVVNGRCLSNAADGRPARTNPQQLAGEQPVDLPVLG